MEKGTKKPTSKELSAKMLSEVLHEVSPHKYPPNYITAENYDQKKEEVARVFTQTNQY